MEIVEDVDETSYTNNGKPWKSSSIFRVKPFFHFSFFFSSFFSIFFVFFGEPKWLRNVEWLYYSKRMFFVRWADLSDFFSLIFVGKMCVLFHVQ